MPTLQLQYGDLVLDVAESWGESIDWGTEALAVPGNWMGVSYAREAFPRRITLQGFIGSAAADPTQQHRDDLSSLIYHVDQSVQDSKRRDSALWRLYAFTDRFLECRPVSFVYDHIDGMSWASRFTAQFVADDPRWYVTSTSSCISPALSSEEAGAHQWASFQTSNGGDAPLEPRFYYTGTATTQFRLTNRHANILKNAFLREGSHATTQGVPVDWEFGYGGTAYAQQIYEAFAELYGKAWIELPAGTSQYARLYQTVHMNEPGSVWSLSAAVVTQTMTGDVPRAHLRMEFLDVNEALLGTADSSTISASDTESTLTILNQTAPASTAKIRASFVCSVDANDLARAFMRWMQLERAATNTTPTYQKQDTVQFTMPSTPGILHAWIDCRKATAYSIETVKSATPTDLTIYLTDGNFFSCPGTTNEILFEGGNPSSHELTAYWTPTYWGK